MLIFDENYAPVVLDDVNSIIASNYFWVLDLNLMDFKPVPLLVIEEVSAKSLELSVANTRIVVPENWFLLIVDPETTIVDLITMEEACGKDFKAFVFGKDLREHQMETISVINAYDNCKHVTPCIQRNFMLCYPISKQRWILISPHDQFGKYLKSSIAKDLTA